MKSSLWQFGLLFLVTTLVLSVTLVFVSPSRFIEESIQGDYFVNETTSVLELDSKLYLLQPNVRLASALDDLDWIASYTIERALPNQVTVSYQTQTPIACSQATIYYSVSKFPRLSNNDVLCDTPIQVIGSLDEVMIDSLNSMPNAIRNLIERIEFQETDALVTMKNGQQALVYPDDFSVLQSITQLAPTANLLDLRRNYA